MDEYEEFKHLFTEIARKPWNDVTRTLKELTAMLEELAEQAHDRRVAAEGGEITAVMAAALEESYARGALSATQAITDAMVAGISA